MTTEKMTLAAELVNGRILAAVLREKNDNAHENIARVVDFAVGKHLGALPKSKGKPKVDDGVFSREQKTHQGPDLLAPAMCLDKVLVKLGHKPRSHPKGVHCPRAPEQALGKRVGLGINLENLGFIACLNSRNPAYEDDGGRCNAQSDEGELPVGDEGDNEGGDKGREALEGEAKLLDDAALDQTTVGDGLGGNRAARAEVEVGNLLAEGRPEVGMADVLDDAVGGVG